MYTVSLKGLGATETHVTLVGSTRDTHVFWPRFTPPG